LRTEPIKQYRKSGGLDSAELVAGRLKDSRSDQRREAKEFEKKGMDSYLKKN